MRIVLFLFACALVSCNPVKKVLSDPAKTDIVGREWAKKNPCVNDTIRDVITGTPDTLTEIVEVFDTAYVVDSFEIITPVIKWKIITKTITRVDTLRLTVEDKRNVNLLQQDTAHLKGVITQLTEDRAKERKRANKWMWLFIAACGVIGIGLFFKLKTWSIKGFSTKG